MDNIILRYKNYELLENNSLFELRKDGSMIIEGIHDLDNIFNTIEIEEEKDEKRRKLNTQLNTNQNNTINHLNQVTDLNIIEINYEEIINGRQGFTKKGFLTTESGVKRLFSKEELIDYIIGFYDEYLN